MGIKTAYIRDSKPIVLVCGIRSGKMGPNYSRHFSCDLVYILAISLISSPVVEIF
ncbi:MAG: hypothetical protein JSV88_02070 [Candidatus Aminicenantes bacterium]|nr:MAG: hypothetical protein JSV88_02070 [Candidatus Aminicenantes bacterium]